MPTWLKIVLGILIGSIVVCGGIAGACTLFVKGKADDINAGQEEAKKLAASGGQACLDRALAKNKDCGDVQSMSGAMCVTTNTVFLQTCLDNATDKASMCGEPLKEGERGEAWVDRRCEAVGQPNNDGCKALLGLAFSHCNFGNPTPDTGDTPEEVLEPEEAPPAE